MHRSVIVTILLMVVGMLMEMLGIGMIIPALVIITDPDLLVDYPVFKEILSYFGNSSHEGMVKSALLILLFVFIVKALFLGVMVWQQSLLVARIQADISNRLFKGYIVQPWSFHLQRNSAELIRNITVEMSAFTHSLLLPALTLLTEGLVFSGILILLLVVTSFWSLAVVGLIGGVAWGFHYCTRGLLHKWGELRQFYEGHRIQHLQQGLGGVKEIKLLGREETFITEYNIHNEGSASILQRQTAISNVPRLLFELLAVSGLVALVIIMMMQGAAAVELIPTMGVFAAVAFRFLPSANRIMNSLQSIRFAMPVINTLYDEMQLSVAMRTPIHQGRISFQDHIEVVDLCYKYSGDGKQVLSGLNLTIHRGQCVGLIGRSGAGKSTLIDLILGLHIPINGNVLVDGIDIHNNIRSWQDEIGYVPQSIYLTDDTLRKNIAFGLSDSQIDEDAVLHSIKSAQLEEFVGFLPDGINTFVGEHGVRISGGQRQRIGIARALYHDPQVLVLDEATSSIDSETESAVMRDVNKLKRKKTIIIIAHRKMTVANCDEIYRLDNGKLSKVNNSNNLESIQFNNKS